MRTGLGWLSGLVGSGASAMGGGLSWITGLVSSAAFKGISSMLNGIVSGLSNSLSGVAKFALSLPGLFLRGTSEIGSGILKTLRFVATSGAKILSEGLRLALGAAAIGISGVVSLIGKSIQTLTSQTRAIVNLRTQTGLSSEVAGGTLNRFASLGIDRNEAASTLGAQNPALFAMKAGIFGLPGYTSSNFAPQLASQYQGMQGQGVIGQLMAKQMLSSLGLDNATGLKMVSMRPGEIESRQSYSSGVQRSLGLNSSSIESAGRQFDLFTSKLTVLGEGVLTKIALTVLPRFNSALDVLANSLGNNAGKIGDFVSNGVIRVVEGIATFGEAMLNIPTFLFSAASSVLDFAGVAVSALPTVWQSFLTGLSIVQTGLGDVMNFGQGVIEQARAGFDQLVQTGASAWERISAGFGQIADIVTAGLQTAQQLAPIVFGKITEGLNAVYNSPLVQQIIAALPAATQVLGGIQSVVGAGSNAVAGIASAASGGDPSWTALGGLAGGWMTMQGLKALPGLALGMAGRAIMGGGAAAGAAGGPGLWSMAMSNPVTGSLIHGGAAGALGYTALQRTGVLGQSAPGFWEALGNTSTRMSNLWHGRDYNAGVTQQNGYTAEQNAATMAAAKAQSPTGQIENMVRAGIGNVSQMYQNNLAAAQWARTTPTLDVNSAASQGGAGGIASMLSGILGNGADSVTGWARGVDERGRENRGSWAQGLDDRYGGELNAMAARTQSALNEARGALDKSSSQYENSEAVQVLRDMLAELKGARKSNTDAATQMQERLIKAMNAFGASVVHQAMEGVAREEYLNLIR